MQAQPPAIRRLARWPAKVWLLVALLGAIAGCTAETPATTIATTATPDATVALVAERFVAAINRADGSGLNELIDGAAVAARVIRNLDLETADRQRYVTSLGAQFGAVGYSMAAQMATQKATAQLLRTTAAADGGEFLVRISTLDPKGNQAHGYLRVKLDAQGRIVDWFDHAMAQWMSGQLAFYALGMLTTEQAAQLLFGGGGDAAATALAMRELTTRITLGDHASAHAALAKLPEAIRQRREFAALKVSFARQVGFAAYREAMIEFAARHGDDADVQFLMIDHYLLSKQPAKALQAIDRAAQLIVDDEVMEANRCHALHDLGRKADAVAACDRAIARNPTFETPRWTRARLALETKDAALAIESLSGVEAAQGKRLDAGRLAKNKVYAWLIQQPEWVPWATERGWTPTTGTD